MTTRRRSLAVTALVAAASLLASVRTGRAVDVRVGVGVDGAVSVAVPMKTWAEMMSEGVVMQQLDFTCGAAALATVLDRHLGVPVGEREIIDFILRTGDVNAIVRQGGFTLLDLRRFVRSLGMDAEGYRVDFDGLLDLGTPVITPLLVRGSAHYVVVRGCRNGRVLLSDPVMGRLSVSVAGFMRTWALAGRDAAGAPEGTAFRVVTTRPRALRPLADDELQAVDDDLLRALARDAAPHVQSIPGEL